MTTNIDTGEQMPPCKNHLWLYMKTLKNKDGRECYILYCPYCWQKSAHISDFSEEEFVKMVFEDYDKKGIGRRAKAKKKQEEN